MMIFLIVLLSVMTAITNATYSSEKQKESCVQCVAFNDMIKKADDIIDFQYDESQSIYNRGFTTKMTMDSSDKVTNDINEKVNSFEGLEKITKKNEHLITKYLNVHTDEISADMQDVIKQLNEITNEQFVLKYNILSAKMDELKTNSKNIIREMITVLEGINVPSLLNDTINERAASSEKNTIEILEEIRSLQLSLKSTNESFDQLNVVIESLIEHLKWFFDSIERKLSEMEEDIEAIKRNN